VEDHHSDKSDEESKDTLPSDDLERLERVLLENPLLDYELGCGEDLSKGNQAHTDNGAQSRRKSHHLLTLSLDVVTGGRVLEHGTSHTNDTNTDNDNEESEPLERVENALQEDDTEETNKENEGSTGHLVDTGGDEKKTDIHEGSTGDVTNSGDGKKEHLPPGDKNATILSRNERFQDWVSVAISLVVARADRLVSVTFAVSVAPKVAKGEESDDNPTSCRKKDKLDLHVGTLYRR
jgi:hypothetical protein